MIKFKFAASSILCLLLASVWFIVGCGSGSRGGTAVGSILVVGDSSSIAAGKSTQLHAIDSTILHQTTDVTDAVKWSSSDTTIATISSTGILSAVNAGNALITAKLGASSGSMSVSVTEATAVSLSISPQAVAISPGSGQQYKAIATLSNNSSLDVTTSSAWSVTPATVATISSKGLLSAIAAGSYTIKAVSGSLSAVTSGVVIAPSLTSIAVTPANPTLVGGASQQFTATGTYSDKSTANLSKNVIWSSSSTAALTINDDGLGMAIGGSANASVTVTASLGTVTGTDSVVVTPGKTLATLQVKPTSSSIAEGSAEQHLALATYSDGTQADVTSSVKWSVVSSTTKQLPKIAPGASGSAVATINQQGTDRGMTPGTAMVQATLGSMQSQSVVLVTAATVKSISISSSDNTFPVGAQQQLVLTGTFSDGSQQDLSIEANWKSSDPSIATIDSNGWSTGVSSGNVQFNASFGGLTAISSRFTVGTLKLISTVVSVPYPVMPLGVSEQLSVIGTYSDGTTQDLTKLATWTASNPKTFPVSNTGVVYSLSAGDGQIVATVFGKNAVVNLEGLEAKLESIQILPVKGKLALGTTLSFVALGHFSDGAQVDISSPVVWTSANPNLLTIDATGRAKSGAVGTTHVSASLFGVTGVSTDVQVTTAAIAHLSATPATAQIAELTNAQFSATGFFTDGSFQDLTPDVSWTSSDNTVARIGVNGVAYGIKPGTVEITATFMGQSVITMLAVTDAILTSVDIVPGNTELPVGITRPFSLVGSFSDGTKQDLTRDVVWLAPTPSIVSVVEQGVVTGISSGEGAVSAERGFFSASTEVNVTNASLTSIALTPAANRIRKGTQEQLTATGTFSDGFRQNLYLNSVFSSGNPLVAVASATGLISGVGVGSTSITASYRNKSASTTSFDVLSDVLSSINIAPDVPEVDAGKQVQLTATGIYADQSAADISGLVSWKSADPSLLTVDEIGLATAVAGATVVKQVVVTAQWGMTSRSVSVTIEPAGTLPPEATLQSIDVTPTSGRIAAGTMEQFAAIGNFSDGSTKDLTALAVWSSSNVVTATVTNAGSGSGAGSSGGLVKGLAPGTISITAKSATFSGRATVIVTPARLLSVAISPSEPSFAVGASQQLTLKGTFSDGTSQDLTGTATWISLTPSVATVSTNLALTGLPVGLVTGVASGAAEITGSFAGQSAETTVDITSATMLSLQIAPGTVSIAKGTRQQFRALGNYSDGTVHTLTTKAIFSSSDTSILTVGTGLGSGGLAIGTSVGVAKLSASFDGETATTDAITVTAASLTTIAISPNAISFADGTTEQFTATGTFSDGTMQDLSSQAIWRSSNPAIVTIGSTGLANGNSLGTVSVTASMAGIRGSSGQVQVTAAVLNGLAISPLTASIAKGTTRQFTATGSFSDGSAQNLSSLATWTTSNPSVVSVDQTGLATGLGVGPAEIQASYQGKSAATTSFSVTAAALVSIAFDPANPSIAAGTGAPIKVIGTFSDGTTQDLTPDATFVSSNPAAVTVSSTAVLTGVAPGTSTITVQVDGKTGSFSVTVTSATLSSLTLMPANPASVPKGATEQFTVAGNYSDGSSQTLVTGVSWASSNPAVATIDGNGLLTGVTVGSLTVSASYQGKSATSATVQVTAAAVASVVVAPASTSVVVGSTQQYTAMATNTDGSMADVTSSANWTSVDPSIATVDSTGLATGVSAGNTTIGARVASGTGTVSASGALTVTAAAPALTAIIVAPTSSHLAAGTTQQFNATPVYASSVGRSGVGKALRPRAIGIYSDGSRMDLTELVSWTSSDISVAIVSSSGLARGITPGSATIGALLGSITGQATVVVTSATLTSIAISPSGASFAAGATQQFTVKGTFSDGSTQDLTSAAIWSSLALGVATVSPAGLAVGVMPGTADITATYGGQSAATTVQITAATLTSATISPLMVTLAEGTQVQFHVQGTYSDGTMRDLTGSAVFTSSDGTILGIAPTGLAIGIAAGTAQISATVGGITITTQTVTVTPATLMSILVTPSIASFADGTTQQFVATGIFSDGSSQDLSLQVVWASTNPGVLTISATGLASGGGVGNAQVQATLNGISASSGTVQVTAAQLTGITLSPLSATIAKGTSQQFTATGRFTDGSVQNISSNVTWVSSNPAVVSIDANGLTTGSGLGTAQITALFQGLSVSTSSFQVTSATLVSIAFNPANPSIAAGTGAQVTVLGTFSDGSTQDITSSASFTSSNPAAATVTLSGVVTGIAPGTSTITVAVAGLTSSFNVTVTSATLTAITLTPIVPSSIAKGTTEQFTATGTYSDGNMQDLSSTVTWTSANSTVATIDSNGLVTGRAIGSNQVTASYQTKTATSASFVVTMPLMASITVTPSATSATAGGSQQFTATATYTDNSTQDVSSFVVWASSSPSVATINVNGVASAISVGGTTISATLNGLSDTAALTVTTPPPVTLSAITIAPASASVAKGNTQQFVAIGQYSDGSTQNLSMLVAWQSSVASVATIDSNGLASTLSGGTTQIWATYQGVNSVVTLAVSSATLVSLAITPGTASVANGTSQQYKATGTLTDGSTQDLTTSVSWASSNSVAATIDANGFATTHGTGTSTISAQAGVKTAAATLTVTAATPTAVQLSPASIALPAGGTQQLLATATFTDGSSQNVTSSVTYTSSNPAIATVSVSGEVTAISAGTASISCTLGAASTSVPVTVSSAVLSSIAITPTSVTLAAGLSQQLTATGTFSDGSTQNLTTSVTWTSSSSHVASVSTGGNVVTATAGTATISATSGSISGSITVTVTSAIVSSLTVSPASVTLAAGQTQQFAAIATMSDGTQQTITSSVHWSVTDPSKGTISNATGSNGLLTTSSAGTMNVTATVNSVSGQAAVTVTTAALSSIAVTPNPVSLPSGTNQALVVTGSYTDGSTANLTSSAAWSSAAASTATVSAAGVLSANSLGSTTVTAVAQGKTATDAVTVTSPVLESISIMPTSATLALGLHSQLTAIGTYLGGGTADITSQVQWSSSAPAVATVSGSGLVNTLQSGSATLTATLNSVTQSIPLTVTGAVLQSIAVQAASSNFALGLSVQLSAVGTYSDSSTQVLTSLVTWSSGMPSVGVVSSSGLATGVATGSFSARAALSGITGSLTLTVTSAVLQTIVVTPASSVIVNLPGNKTQFTATGHYSDGTTVDITDSVHWSVSGIVVGSISQMGTFSATGLGAGTVTAVSGTITGSTGLLVVAT